MPLYFMDIWEGAELIPDDVGTQCRDLHEAEVMAANTVASLARECWSRVDPADISIIVRDDSGREVLTLTATLQIKRTLG